VLVNHRGNFRRLGRAGLVDQAGCNCSQHPQPTEQQARLPVGGPFLLAAEQAQADEKGADEGERNREVDDAWMNGCQKVKHCGAVS
jgi:hypothetical protein